MDEFSFPETEDLFLCIWHKKYFPNEHPLKPLTDKNNKHNYCNRCYAIYNKQLYEKNPQRHITQSKRWRERNKEHSKEYNKKWIEDNLEHVRRRKKEWNVKNSALLLLKSAQRRAKMKSIEFNINITEWMQKINNTTHCEVTGIEFHEKYSRADDKRVSVFSRSLDRIDANMGYVEGNVRIVCVIVNMAISDFGLGAFDIMCMARAKVILSSGQPVHENPV